MTSKGGCGDAVRNVTGCPVAGLDADELFDCRAELTEVVNYFINHDEYLDLPRKHKITIATCADQCNAPEINCIAFIGARSQAGRRAARVRGARRRRALLDAAHRPRPRRLRRAGRGAGGRAGDPGRLAARPEVPDLAGQGAAEVPGRRLRRRGRPQGRRGAAGPQARRPGDGAGPDRARPTTWASTRRRSTARSTSASRSSRARSTATQAIADRRPGRVVRRRHPADPPAELHPDRRPGRARRTRSSAKLAEIGFPLDVNRFAAPASPAPASRSATTRWPRPSRRCSEIVERLETRFGTDVEGLKLGVDGCPHACAHHWITDIGLQGTTARGDGVHQAGGVRDLPARRPRRATPTIGRPVLRRVPAGEAVDVVERLVAG